MNTPTNTNDRRVPLSYLRAWREAKLISQGELSERTGVAESTISKLEHGGRANMRTVGKLAEGLGIARQQLVYEQPSKEHSFFIFDLSKIPRSAEDAEHDRLEEMRERETEQLLNDVPRKRASKPTKPQKPD